MERKNRGILKNKLFLYLTEFFSGMSVMAVELGASRLLAPYFSSSQIVWTIIIGTIMIAMALGNIYGGRTADKSPNPDKLYGRIIVAALWLCADVCYDPCGWNIDHFSDLCGNFTCVIHRVFCDGKSREKESDCIGTYFRVLLWNRLFRFLRILGKQPDI